MARADRLARIDADRIAHETDYRAALIAALETTAKGRWGLFGHQGKKGETSASVATVAALISLGETIDDLRATLGLEPFALHAAFVAARGPVRSDAVGEPKQAQAWLDRLNQQKTETL
ncbi:hypothetical protein [Sphingomonas sp. CARO-RG-8B-R24-01]|uniref:hypothetical protein n=1 Tax=Sphingomonas sp. CARO-RG-8B-R24-01 TaxID=2914831 RepID=UPI001F5A02D0|nr:hypothetical protein [Sphingomonas sp. CARO-RG-8B-R24-01]